MKTRNYGIDVIKGMCILLVVLCHTVLFENLPTVLARIANGVFLNLFFMVSGYLAWKPDSDDKDAYIKRIGKRFKAIPHNYCRADAKSDFWSDCIKILQAYWRMSRDFCVI